VRRPRASALAGVVLAAAAGCQTVAPALTSLLMAFGQDLLAATAVNYTPRYAVEVENLLAVLARQATGLEFQGQLAQAGYQPPPPEYLQNQQPGYDQTGGYGQYGQAAGAGGYGQYGQTAGGGYDQTASYPQYGQQSPDQDPYATTDTTDPYGSGPPSSDTAGYPDPYTSGTGTADSAESGYGYGYGQATYGNDYTPPAGSDYQDPYAAGPGNRTRSAGGGPISLGVALLARRAGSTTLTTVEDGDTLHDGRGDPSRGDLLRVHFQSNCACWVYVVGIDATGYVAQIFPDADSGQGNPVTAGTNYLMPGGDDWWGLDDHRGIEQVYFVAAREPRPEIEAAVARLAAQPRQLASTDYRPVSEPAILPNTRGLVKVSAPAPVNVPQGGGSASAQVTPAIFTNNDDATDLVITRWFRHE
jgi:hypothetical protein